MNCFPPQLSWLVRVLYDVLLTAKRTDTREVSAICVDLVFAFFLCPAMVTPEPYGICDAPISHISSFNLMQVRLLFLLFESFSLFFPVFAFCLSWGQSISKILIWDSMTAAVMPSAFMIQSAPRWLWFRRLRRGTLYFSVIFTFFH